MSNEPMHEVIENLQDSIVVMAHLEKRQEESIARTEEEVGRLTAFRLRTEKEILEFRHRTGQNLADITDQLNGLIGYIAGQRPDPGLKH